MNDQNSASSLCALRRWVGIFSDRCTWEGRHIIVNYSQMLYISTGPLALHDYVLRHNEVDQ